MKPRDAMGHSGPAVRRAVPHSVKKAIAHMRASAGATMAIGKLAPICGVSERTLHKHFRAFIGLSPLAYWRRLRLGQVRECLLAGADGQTISAIALRHGFEHFGRFSAQYRACFGEAASATLRRARTAVPGTRVERISAATTGALRYSRERPSLAVLSFRTTAGNADHEAFGEALGEGIAIALARVRSLTVIMPPALSRAARRPRHVVSRPSARYCLLGRIAQAGGRLRVAVRLVDASTDRHLWGDSFDGEVGDLFGLQDRVIEGVARAIIPSIRGAEIERARRKQPNDLDAHDLTMRALPFAFAANPHSARQALDHLDRAMEIDPDFALPAALAAWCHAQLVTHNGTPAPVEEKAHALRLIERAAVLDVDDPLVATAQCAVYTMVGAHDVAAALLDRALALDPTSAWTWERSGWLNVYIGEVDAAIRDFRRAIALDGPHAPNASRFIGIGCAYFDAGRYEAGALWMRRAILQQPGTVWVNRTLAVSYLRMGEQFAARDSLEALRRYRPDLTIAQVVGALPFRPDFMERVAQGLDDLGLPP